MAEARLTPAFFERDAVEVARDLIGRFLRHGDVVLRITESEAYCGPEDTACHAKSGRTVRNAPLWGPAGHAYVYLCYGLHSMLNLVTGAEGACVLVRACEPVAGLERIRARRGDRQGPELLAGPGRVAAALALDPTWSHHPLCEPGGLEVLEGRPAERILVGPRVGIDYAAAEHRDAPWRFAEADSRWVSRRQSLRPES